MSTEHHDPVPRTLVDVSRLPSLLRDVIRRYSDIRYDRGLVYGDPRENHRGIAMMWAPLLQPFWDAIRDMEPVPEHVVALLIAALKLDRMRLTFHADNYVDDIVYKAFAYEWQRAYSEHERSYRLPESRRTRRVYVSGPFTAPTAAERFGNAVQAATIGEVLLRMGHHVHVPHTHTLWWDGEFSKERFLLLDETVLRFWATDLLRIAPSPGADHERDVALGLGLPVLGLADIDTAKLPNLTGAVTRIDVGALVARVKRICEAGLGWCRRPPGQGSEAAVEYNSTAESSADADPD